MTLNRTNLLWLFSSVMSIYSLCLLPDVASFHLARPVRYISFFEDEIDGGMENSSFEVNNQNTFSDMKTKLQNGIMTSKVVLSGSSSDLEGSSDEPPKLELFESSFPEKTRTFMSDEVDNNLSELPNYISESPDYIFELPSKSPDNISNSPDCLSKQFSRFYLEQITNLLQRMMGIFFSSNEHTENTPLINSDCDTNVHRHIKKRDLSQTENVLHNNTNWSTVDDIVSAGNYTTTHVNLKNNFYSSTGITKHHKNITNETSSSVQQGKTENNISSYENKLPYSLENSSENTLILNVTEVNEHNKHETTLHTIYNETKFTSDIIKTDDLHVTSVSYKPSSVKEMLEDFVNDTVLSKKNILEETKISKTEEKDNMANDDPINNISPVLKSVTITNQINPVRKEIGSAEFNGPRIPNPSGGYYTQDEASSAGNMLAITGSVFLLIVVASVGAVTSYKLWKRNCNRDQAANQNPSHQRTSLA